LDSSVAQSTRRRKVPTKNKRALTVRLDPPRARAVAGPKPARAPYLRQFPMGGSSALRRHLSLDLSSESVVLALVWTFVQSSGRGEESIALREKGISTSFPRGFGILELM